MAMYALIRALETLPWTHKRPGCCIALVNAVQGYKNVACRKNVVAAHDGSSWGSVS